MSKQQLLSLQERINLSLRHLTLGIDRRPAVQGTALEDTAFTLSYMGKHLVQMHATPDLYECPGRYLTALALCLDANPSFSVDGKSAEDTADRMVNYLDRRINAEGKAEVTDQELSLIDSPDYILAEPVSPENPEATAKGWWNAAHGVICDAHVSIAMEGLVRWFLRTGDAKTRNIISRMIQGKVSDPFGPEVQSGKGMVNPGMMNSLIMYYEATSDESPRQYLDEFARYFLSKQYLGMFPDGKHSHGEGVGHLHVRMGGIAALARYGKLVGRSDYVDAAAELLAANMAYGTEFGWMPERHVFCVDGHSDSGGIYQPWAVGEGTINYSHFARPRCGWDTCEICVTADAIDTAIFLARSGYEKYWDVAERLLNQVNESQIRDDSFFIEREKGMHDTITSKFENVADDMLGGFSSYTSPTWVLPRRQYPDMRPDGREGVREGDYYSVGIACCHGWGARTLGIVWHNIVTEEGSRVEVNFPFDRTTANVEMKTGLPLAGNISITALKPIELYVRIPDWVEHSRAEVTINGKRLGSVEFKNPFSDYVKVGSINAGDKVIVSYPLRIENKRYIIEYHPNLYEANWLGNSVMGMKEIGIAEPQGTELFTGFGKLYQYSPDS